MATLEQYRKKVQSGGEQQAGDGNAYELARNQEYTALLDKEVQLENAKQNAIKYTNDQMARNGMAGTGYGSTAQSAIYGQYMNALGSAQNTSQQNISNINLQEAQNNQETGNDRFKAITTMLTSASSQEQMDNLLKDYGYMKDDGSWLDKKPDSMTDDDWYQMRYYYNLQKDALSSTTNDTRDIAQYIGSSTASGYDITTLGNTIAGKNDDMKFSEEFGYEYKKLARMIQTDQLDKDGTMIKLQRGDSKGEGPRYLFYYKGKFYNVAKEKYDEYAKKRYILTDHDAKEDSSKK